MYMDITEVFIAGGRSQLSVTIVEVAGSSPAPSPLSDRSNEQLLQTPLESGEHEIDIQEYSGLMKLHSVCISLSAFKFSNEII